MQKKVKLYFSIHQSAARIIGNFLGRLILLPHPSSIGNALEDYLHGLLIAKRNNQKLTIITMNGFLKRSGLMLVEPAYLQFTDKIVQPAIGSWQQRSLSTIFSAYFFVSRQFIKVIYKVAKVNIRDSYFHPSTGQDLLWIPPGSNSFSWENLCSRDWENALENSGVHLKLSEKLEAEQKELLRKLGIKDDDWFVCLHVRDGGYWGDWDNRRNANISDYLMAIDNIVSRGGWVVRLGDPTMTKLPIMDRVIDMAHHPLKSALLDTYLTANCSFFIGTLSGMHEYSYLFSKPSLITNSFTYLATLPMKPNDIIIFKHVYSVSKNRFLTIHEWLDAYQQIDEKTWTSTDWVYHDNTSEEILIAVSELLDGKKLGNSAPEQLEFKQLHLKSMVWVGEHFRFNNNDNLNSIHIRDQFRFFTQYISWKGNVGNDFLTRNW